MRQRWQGIRAIELLARWRLTILAGVNDAAHDGR